MKQLNEKIKEIERQKSGKIFKPFDLPINNERKAFKMITEAMKFLFKKSRDVIKFEKETMFTTSRKR